MKTILTTLNAKYIHTSLALRWLYVVNKNKFDISFKEYAIKEDVNKIYEELIDCQTEIIGLGVYIWNVKQSKLLVDKLKSLNPNLIIILGGPEVSYEPEFFIENWDIDYVISGEGEFVLGELLTCLNDSKQNGVLHKHTNYNINGVSTKGHISKHIVQADINQLINYQSPYQLEEDLPNLKNRLVYFESSRGCPYQCQYCLSSLEKGVRYFPENYIKKNLSYLIDSGAKQVKFLDRTFNLNKKHTKRIFDFLIDNHRPNLSFQFEIYADLLNDDTITYINELVPEKYFRFEIGIQSTFEPTNIEVKRKQDFQLLANNIKMLMDGGKVDLHLDLIAGLPYESFERFVKSFNDVFKLGAKEVQLGFLKLLRGTNLRRDAEKYGYKFNEEAPYEIIESKDITAEELNRIKDAEHALEKFWNSGRFTRTMNLLFKSHYFEKYFELFDEIGQYYNEHNLPHHSYQLEDLFNAINDFLITKGINAFETLRDDYYSNFTTRPTRFWTDDTSKEERKAMLYKIGQDKEFLNKHKLNRKIIEKQTAINKLNNENYLLTLFLQQKNIKIHLNIVYVCKNT
ncbi:B12-binding domain-containing radical SAM protein [Paludibacter sp.]